MNGQARAAILLVVAILVGAGLVWINTGNTDNKQGEAVASASASGIRAPIHVSAPTLVSSAPVAPQTELTRVPLLPVDQSLSATQSLADARENGDSRVPPIKHEPDLTQTPTAAELADPKAYQAYEVRQNLRLYAAFNQAANVELPKLRSDVERGRAAGIAPEEIAKVEEKIRRIEVEQAKLLKEHPELAR